MPDWTYHPLSPIAASVLGEHRTRVLALRILAVLIRKVGGRQWIPAVFDHPVLPPKWSGRFGATVSPRIAFDAITVLPVQGADVVEINPVRVDDAELVRRAVTGRRCRVIAVADSEEAAEAIAGDVDAVSVGAGEGTVRLWTPDPRTAVEALGDPSMTVLATTQVLVTAGPGWFHRVIEAGTPTSPPPALRDVPPDPRRWPGWIWTTLVGLGLIIAGLGAAAIALGPVLLWYDRDYLGASVADLHAVNENLVGFLQHDRISMAGNMIGIGILYLGLAAAMRLGFRWARRALSISGTVAFASYFYFLGTGGFVEPLHTVVVIVLVPMFIAAVWPRPVTPHWRPVIDVTEAQRRRALWGQLLLIGVGAGLTVAGMVISAVGFTSVFVPTDLDFMGAHAAHFHDSHHRLVPFIAHDRAGFGGALVAAGLAVALMSMWGWRPGQRFVWWCLLLGCAVGTVPVLVVHFAIGYTHFEHLLPVYALVVATGVGLGLSKEYLTASPKRRGQQP